MRRVHLDSPQETPAAVYPGLIGEGGRGTKRAALAAPCYIADTAVNAWGQKVGTGIAQEQDGRVLRRREKHLLAVRAARSVAERTGSIVLGRHKSKRME